MQSRRHARASLFAMVSVCVLLGAGALLFWNLGAHSISLRSDEVVYARVTQSVLHDGAWWSLKHGPAPFFEKPPMKFWLAGIAVAVMGESNLSFRFLDACFGGGVLVLTLLLSIRLFGPRLGAILSLLFVMTCLEAVIGDHGMRRATLDSLLTLLTALTMLLCWRIATRESAHQRGWFAVFGLTVGVAILTKSAGGVVPFVSGAVALLLCWPRGRFRELIGGLIVSAATAFLVASPYFAFHLLTSDRAVRIILHRELAERVFDGIEQHNAGDPFFYLRYLFTKSGLVPSSFLLLSTPFLAIASRRERAVRFLLPWLLVPLAGFSLSVSKAPWYLLPALPACAILVGYALEEIPQRLIRRWRLSRSPLLLVVALAGALLMLRGMDELSRKARAVVSGIAAQRTRIAVDLLTEKILHHSDARVVFLPDTIPDRVAPIRGKFNVEGIYREMLRDREIPRQSIGAYPVVYVFATAEQIGELPTGGRVETELAPFSIRKHPVMVMKFGNGE